MSILDFIPRWVLAALVLALSATSCKLKWENGDLSIEIEKGKTYVAQLETAIAKSHQTSEAILASNERRAREAEQAARTRSDALAADAARSRSELERLRTALAAYRTPYGLTASKAAIAPSLDATAPIDDLLTVSDRYVDLAAKCDRHVNDIQTLMAAWPK